MNRKGVDYLGGKLFPMILRFSIPAAVSLLITAVYNIVDRMFVGNFNGTSALAGLSVCFPLSYMMMAFALMCSAGGSTFFSLFSGKNETERMNRSFGNAMVLLCVSEIGLSGVLLGAPDFFLKIFGVTKTAYPYAIRYYRIVALGCVFQGLSQLFCDFVRVSGKPVLGMCVTGIGAVANIILDGVFIIVFDWGVVGAAVATVMGQVLSALFGAWMVFGNRTQVRVERGIFRLERRLCLQIVSCGFAFFVAQMAMGFISLVYNSQLGRYGGDMAISVYAVISSIMTFVIMPASGISQGIQPIIGNNYGSGNYRRVLSAFWLATALSVSITCVIWLMVLVFPQQILAAFGGTEEMFQVGIAGLRINFCITPALGFVMLATTFFQAINRPVPSIIITVLRQVVFLVPFIYVLPMILDINGIFFAQPISDLLATVLSLYLVWREGGSMIRGCLGDGGLEEG